MGRQERNVVASNFQIPFLALAPFFVYLHTLRWMQRHLWFGLSHKIFRLFKKYFKLFFVRYTGYCSSVLSSSFILVPMYISLSRDNINVNGKPTADSISAQCSGNRYLIILSILKNPLSKHSFGNDYIQYDFPLQPKFNKYCSAGVVKFVSCDTI